MDAERTLRTVTATNDIGKTPGYSFVCDLRCTFRATHQHLGITRKSRHVDVMPLQNCSTAAASQRFSQINRQTVCWLEARQRIGQWMQLLLVVPPLADRG